MGPMEQLIRVINQREDWREFLTSKPNSIAVKPHPTWPDVYVFSYHMIDTKWSPERDYLRACRGSMIRVDPVTRGCEVLAYAFDKFFNLKETHAAKLNWDGRVKVYEKLDGSLVKLGWYKDRPFWMLNNAPTAEVPLPDTIVNDGKFPTFMSLIDHIHSVDPWPCPINAHGWTLMFELTSPYNTVVLKYPEPKLWLIGARRNTAPFEELLPEDAKARFDLKFDTPRLYPFGNLEDVEMLVGTLLNDSDHEGVVVMDSDFNRVKMKAESYLALHRLKDGDGNMTQRRLWECIHQGLVDDVVGQWPEYAQRAEELKNKLEWARSTIIEALLMCRREIRRLDEYYSEGQAREKRKDYAQFVKEGFQSISKLCFKVYDDYTFRPETVADEFLRNLKDPEEMEKIL